VSSKIMVHFESNFVIEYRSNAKEIPHRPTRIPGHRHASSDPNQRFALQPRVP
jgi:hypothetical protein